MTATAISDPDMCWLCRRAPAATVYGGLCEPCFSRSVWYLDLPWSER